jgi:hypothetical protein
LNRDIFPFFYKIKEKEKETIVFSPATTTTLDHYSFTLRASTREGTKEEKNNVKKEEEEEDGCQRQKRERKKR